MKSAKSSPRRIQLSRTKGWRIPANTVVVSRPSKWGNPFRVDNMHSRLDCVRSYERWIVGTAKGAVTADNARRELRGRNLACWCPLGGPCHADILLKIANGPGQPSQGNRRPNVRSRAARAA